MTLLAGTLLALLAVAIVLEPLIRPMAPTVVLRPDSDDEDITPEQRQRDLALAALKEIEFDKATGKLSDADYDRLYQRYAAEAVVAIRAAEHPQAARLTVGAATGGQAVGRSGGQRRPKFCAECGSRLEASGKFCSECGSPVV